MKLFLLPELFCCLLRIFHPLDCREFFFERPSIYKRLACQIHNNHVKIDYFQLWLKVKDLFHIETVKEVVGIQPDTTYLRHCYSDSTIWNRVSNSLKGGSHKITFTVSFIIMFSNLLFREAKDEISRLSSKNTSKDDPKDTNLKTECQLQDDTNDVKDEEDEEMEQDEENKDMLEDSDGK